MNDREDSLIRSAAALPRDIQPDRDLWPGIASRLDRRDPARIARRRPRWPVALAAGIALVALSSGATWWLMEREAITAGQLAVLMTPAPDPVGQDAELLQIRRELTATLDRSLARLSPATRRQVVTNLAEIHQGLAAIRAALEEDPNNTFLHQLLYTTYQQELALMTNINKLALSVPNEVEI